MSRASGPASQDLITGDFRHKPSGITYRVFEQDGRVWMSYERTKGETLRGQRELLYYIGSGVKGRSYLFSENGFWFESPVNWYGQEHRWNMTPAYMSARELPLNLPSLIDCMNCHASGLQPPAAGTENKFDGQPFRHAGITCERCHGNGEEHMDGKGPIVNPAKLNAERRDSVCMECHFEGTVAVEQAGKHLYEFRPGDRLQDFTRYFVLKRAEPEKTLALSQVEALGLSKCKEKTGEKMSCVSCHNPHSEPSAEEKAAFYRAKCLACHGEIAKRHHPDKPDCTGCHMPKLPDAAVAHTESTDHRILKYPNGFQMPVTTKEPELVTFPANDGGETSTRDLALAWETLAERKVERAAKPAEQYLRAAATQAEGAGSDDARVLSGLAFIEQEHGKSDSARQLYERALRVDPLANDAATNLGALEARAGHLRRAVELWQGAFSRAPHRSEIGVDLALAFCATGQTNEARMYVERVLEFNPDFGNAKRLLNHLSGDPVQCKP